MRKKLYRLQHTLGITKSEAAAVAVLMTLFLLGVGVRSWHAHSAGDAPFDYTEIDSLFTDATARLQADLAPAPVDSASPGRADAAGGAGRIDINRAGSSELQRLPRIGPALAGRILEYRAARGDFRSVDELTRIAGIGPRTLETLRPLVIVSVDSL